MPPKKTPDMVTKLLERAVRLKGQSTIARETGLTQPAISRYLRGVGEPTTETLKKLADYFGVSLYQLRGDDQLVDGTVEKWFIPLSYYSSLADDIESYLDRALAYDEYSSNCDFIDAAITMSKIFIDGYEEFYDAGDFIDLKLIKQKADSVVNKFVGQSRRYHIKNNKLFQIAQPYDYKRIEDKMRRDKEREVPLAWRRDKKNNDDL